MHRKGKQGSDSDNSAASSQERELMGGKSGSRLRGVVRLRRQLVKHPLWRVRRYRNKVKEKLGAQDPRRAWSYSDYSLKLRGRFGKMTGLWRTHWMMSNILEEATRGNTEMVQMWVVQCLKAIHQVGLDRGSWHNASLLLPISDPLQQEDHGGDEDELLAAHSYQGALAELRKGGQSQPRRAEEDEEDEEPARPPRPAPKKQGK